MSTKEEIIKELQEEIDNNLKEISKILAGKDLSVLNAQLDNRISLSNNSFLEEVKNLSLITVTAAPFSLTLLLSGLEIEKTFLVASFILLMMNVLFLNVGVWYLNSRFRTSTGSQILEAITLEMETSNVLDTSKDSTVRLNSLNELMQGEIRLNKKKRFEPYGQEKILKFLRDWGLILLSVGIILIALSVAWVFVPRSASSIL